MRAVQVIPMYTAQRGYGVGGLLRGLARHALPILKNVGKRALQVGVDALNDASTNNISLKQAFKKRAKQELKSILPINTREQRGKGKRKATDSIDFAFRQIPLKKVRKNKKRRRAHSKITL